MTMTMKEMVTVMKAFEIYIDLISKFRTKEEVTSTVLHNHIVAIAKDEKEQDELFQDLLTIHDAHDAMTRRTGVNK